MRPYTHVALLAGALALAGCYAEVSTESISMRRSFPVCDGGATNCTFAGISQDIQDVALQILGGTIPATQFTLDLGNDFFKAQDEVGPFKLKGQMILDGVTLQLLTPGATFAGVRHLEIVQLPVAGCTGACVARTVASYDRPAAGAPNPTTLTLAGTGANLLEMGSSQLLIEVRASGTLPTIDWRADLTLQGRLSERADFP